MQAALDCIEIDEEARDRIEITKLTNGRVEITEGRWKDICREQANYEALIARQAENRKSTSITIWRLFYGFLRHHISQGYDPHQYEEIFFTIMRSAVFDLTNVDQKRYRTGLRSKASYETGIQCDEHFHPRRKTIKYLWNLLVNENIGFKEFNRVLQKAARVHVTTDKENKALVDYQKRGDYNWREAYVAVGIELVYPDGTDFDYSKDNIPED